MHAAIHLIFHALQDKLKIAVHFTPKQFSLHIENCKNSQKDSIQTPALSDLTKFWHGF